MTIDMTAERTEDPEGRAYRRLWLAVLVQAFRDALLHDPTARDRRQMWSAIAVSPLPDVPVIRDRARTWLMRGRDFAEVCDLAGLDPAAVRDSARRMLANAEAIRRARRVFYN